MAFDRNRGTAMQLGKGICWILVASVLAGILWGCPELEDDEDEAEWQRELHIAPRPTPTPVGPWVTCLVPPLCNEYLTYSPQAWDDIYYSCRNSSDGRGCPFDYDLRCTIEYDDRDGIEGGFSTAPAIKSQASNLRGYAVNSAGSDAVYGGPCLYVRPAAASDYRVGFAYRGHSR